MSFMGAPIIRSVEKLQIIKSKTSQNFILKITLVNIIQESMQVSNLIQQIALINKYLHCMPCKNNACKGG